MQLKTIMEAEPILTNKRQVCDEGIDHVEQTSENSLIPNTSGVYFSWSKNTSEHEGLVVIPPVGGNNEFATNEETNVNHFEENVEENEVSADDANLVIDAEVSAEVDGRISRPHKQDGMRAWIVCAIALFNYSIVLGMYESSLLTALGNGPSENENNIALKVSFISSLNYAVSSLCCLLTGPLCDLLGVRLLAVAALLFGTVGSLVCALAADRSLVLWIIGYGVLIAVSTAFYEVSCPVLLRYHFQRHYGLANGVFFVGSGMISAIIVVLWEVILSFGYVDTKEQSYDHSEYVIDATAALANETTGGEQVDDFKKYQASRIVYVMFSVAALYIVGGVLSVVCWTDNRGIFELKQLCSSLNHICSCFLFGNLFSKISTAQVPQRLSARQRIFCKWRLLRNSDFLILTAAHTAANMAEITLNKYEYLYDFIKEAFPNESAIWAILSLCMGLAAGMLLAGCLADRYRRLCMQIYLMAGGLWYSALLSAAMPTLIVYIQSFMTRALIYALLGFGNGGYWALYYVSIASIVATEDLPQAVGILSAVSGLTYLVGAALAGWLVHAYESYHGVAFLVSGALGQLGALTFLFVSTERQMNTCTGSTD